MTVKMTDLAHMDCVPDKDLGMALSVDEIKRYQQQVPDWKIVNEDGEQRIKRSFKFKDFASALAFTNKVGQIAEQQNHHPTLLTEWGQVTVTWWTHKVHGLHLNDFIMAAKTDTLQ